MTRNEPAGGWRRATLTSGVKGGGLQFKHFGSLWRRSVQQWGFYLVRGALDIFKIKARLQSHPWAKAHSVQEKPLKENVDQALERAKKKQWPPNLLGHMRALTICSSPR